MSHYLENPPWWGLVLCFAVGIPLLLLIRGKNKEQVLKLLENDRVTRLAGLLLCALGMGIFFTFHYHPILQMKTRVLNITYARGTLFLAVITCGIGLIMVALGARCNRLVIRQGEKPSHTQSILFLTVLGLGIAAEIAFHRYMVSQGYH